MGLWKCGTIAQYSLGNSAQSWVLPGHILVKSWILGKVDKDIYCLTAGFKSAQDIYFYRADLELDPEPARTYTPFEAGS